MNFYIYARYLSIVVWIFLVKCGGSNFMALVLPPVLRFRPASTNRTVLSTFKFQDPNALELGTILSLYSFRVKLNNICHSNRMQISANL
jgi:hypothetical protein